MKKLIWLMLLLPGIVFAQAEPATESGLNALTDAVEEQTPILEDIREAVTYVAPIIPALCDGLNNHSLAVRGRTLGRHTNGVPDLSTVWHSFQSLRSVKRVSTAAYVQFDGGTLTLSFATVEEAAACRDSLATVIL